MASGNKGFDLAAALGGVPNLNTGEEQIVRIPLERIDPDPENFYSLDGLDELAGNIETVGLLDPIRVRPNGERYTVVSGHRRRAACLLIRDGGSQQFADGVPCIVEYGEASDAMRKLRLIYANSATRQLTSAEQSRQAEEVTRLLYELKEQGVEFPGRMRDHVAEACNVSKSKIARLHAIRENLHPDLLTYYDAGELVEDAAYQISRLPENVQTALSDKLAASKKRKMPVGDVIRAVQLNLDGLQKAFPCRAHAGGPDCHNLTGRIVRSLTQPYAWAICDSGKCCMDCHRSKEGCSGACREARQRANVEKAAEEEKKAERARDAEISQRRLKDRIARRCRELLPYIDRAGLADGARLSGDYRSTTVGKVREFARGEWGEAHFYGDECVKPILGKDAVEMARRLGCPLELALGIEPRPAEVQPDPAPEDEDDGTFVRFQWRIGDPPLNEPNYYAVKLSLYDKPLVSPRVLWWDGEQWINAVGDDIRQRPIDRALHVEAWFPLPKEE